jgi:hypothetical protein
MAARAQHMLGTPEPGSQFVQLEVGKPEGAKRALVQGLCVLASTSQPDDDGGLSVAEDPFGDGRVQTFGQRREDHGDLLRRGFQSIQGSIASSTERAAAGLTTKGLDALGVTMLAIPDQGVDLRIGLAVRALLIPTGVALGVYALGGSSAAFHLTPGAYRSRRSPST